jgi:isoamylase
VRRRGRDGLPDISWFAPDGAEMTDEDWDAGFSKSIAVFLNGHGIPDLDARGQRVLDDSFVLFFNAHNEPIEFTLPPAEFGTEWCIVVDTAAEESASSEELRAAAKLTVDAHSAVVLQAADGSETRR